MKRLLVVNGGLKAAGNILVWREMKHWPEGLVVGHWKVTGPSYRGKGGGLTVPCVSRCGVQAPVAAKDLQRGRPLTCEGCRAGMSPPDQRVACEITTRTNSDNWGSLMAISLSNPNALSRSAHKQWVGYGVQALEDLIGRTGLGLDFGWKVLVKDHHVHKKNGGGPTTYQFREAFEQQARVLVRLRPKGCDTWFDVYVGWVRADVTPAAVVAAFTLACGPAGAADEPDDEPEPQPAAPPPSANGKATHQLVGGPGVEKLERMRDGITRLIALNNDMAALQAMKAEAVQRRDLARAAVADPEREHNAAYKRLVDLSEERDALTRQLAELEAKTAKTRAELERVTAQRAAADHEHSVALTNYEPRRVALEEAEKQVQEVEASERERAAAVSKAGDLSLILAAMERLG